MKKKRYLLSALALLGTLAGLATTMRAQTTAPHSEPRILPPPRPIPVPALNQELQLIAQAARVEINGAVARTKLTQTFQNVTGTLSSGGNTVPVTGKLRGEMITLTAGDNQLTGKVVGDRIDGNNWAATRAGR